MSTPAFTLPPPPRRLAGWIPFFKREPLIWLGLAWIAFALILVIRANISAPIKKSGEVSKTAEVKLGFLHIPSGLIPLFILGLGPLALGCANIFTLRHLLRHGIHRTGKVIAIKPPFDPQRQGLIQNYHRIYYAFTDQAGERIEDVTSSFEPALLEQLTHASLVDLIVLPGQEKKNRLLDAATQKLLGKGAE